MTELYVATGKSILQNYFDYYCKEKLDDAEYVPVVRLIIEGIGAAMVSAGCDEEDIHSVQDRLSAFSRDLYTELWVKHAKEDEGEENVEPEEEAEAGRCYFDYIYKHGKHPG